MDYKYIYTYNYNYNKIMLYTHKYNLHNYTTLNTMLERLHKELHFYISILQIITLCAECREHCCKVIAITHD